MKQVVIIQLVGQTGLRPVGSIVNTDNITAEYWIKSGWATEKPILAKKQEKQTFETKERKQRRKTK